MKYLIDGHNLIARLPDLSLADPDDEEKLVQRLARWRWRHSQHLVTVVFDPGEVAVHGQKRSRQSGIDVHYAAFGSNADTVLIRTIQRSRQPRQLVVVSSDRRIQAVARRAGAQIMAAETFAQMLEEPVEAEEPSEEDVLLSEEEVEAWLRVFRNRKK